MNSPVCISLSVVISLSAVGFIALLISIVLIFVFGVGKKRVTLSKRLLLTVSCILTIVALVMALIFGTRCTNNQGEPSDQQTRQTTELTQPQATAPPTSEPTQTTPSAPDITEPTVPDVTEPSEAVPTLGVVTNTEESDPANWKIKWSVIDGNSIVDSYLREDLIFFQDPAQDAYFTLPGISTFRGDPYRTGGAYGYAEILNVSLEKIWTNTISELPKGTNSGFWSGCGWTGQPLIVQWDAQTRKNMNLYADKKDKEELVEVIYATLDGHIYFYDLSDGTFTRDPIDIGMAFKGSGSLDPRGYPILYVGSGDYTTEGEVPRMFAISLVDGCILFEYGHSDPHQLRGWIAFDSTPLIDAETDTLIWPGESGILYTMKLNTAYEPETGNLTMAPDNIVKTRYSTGIGHSIGYEASAIAVEHYIFIADNGGMLFCVDLNTMELMWAQNVRDDINATPVFEWGNDGNGYLYLGTSMEYADGTVYIAKINASTGEYVWEVSFDNIYYDQSISGGILSSPVLGKKGTTLEGMVIFSISRTPSYSGGILVALDTATGQTVWQKVLTHYCWSSPVAIYSETGEAKILLCDSGGNVMLIDSLTGETLTSVNLGSNMEASPAVFNDILVVGTRGKRICGVRIS